MRHVKNITRVPLKAQSGLSCDTVTSDFQAQLCFVVTLLINFFLPLAEIKQPADEVEGEA